MEKQIEEIKILSTFSFKKSSPTRYYFNYLVFAQKEQILSVSITIDQSYSIIIGKELIGYFKDINIVKDICLLIITKRYNQ